VVLTPAVALDRTGGRLGRGGGDYDRLLPALRARGWTIVGVCHAAQVQERLPLEAHDAPVDAILTDDGLLVPTR
jgi:5-formyltetrahydrofolate cyclo-ligase